MMQIALRKTYTRSFWGKLFNIYTKWKLKTEFCHGGVVVGDKIYQMRPTGLVCEDFKDASNWVLFSTNISNNLTSLRLNKYVGTRYDFFSLLAFVLPFRFSDGHALYCFEVCWLALTGQNPTKAITPELILCEVIKNAQSPSVDSNAYIMDGNNRACDNSANVSI
jgi:hypothetical protein